MKKIVISLFAVPMLLSAGYRGGVYQPVNDQPGKKKPVVEKKIEFNEVVQRLVATKGMRRGDVVTELQKYFSPKKIAKKMIDMMKNGSTEEKIAAVYTASVLRNPKYEKYFKLLLKDDDLDQELKRELIFAIGSNGFKRLNHHICEYLPVKGDRALAIVAIRNSKDAICKEEIKDILKKGDRRDQMQILELLTITGKYQMGKEVLEVFQKGGSGIKFSAALALTAMEHQTGGVYLKKQFNSGNYNKYTLYKNYRSLHQMTGKKNSVVYQLLLDGFKKSSHDSVQLFCGIALLFRGAKGQLKRDIEELVKLHKNSDKMEIVQIVAKYETYLRKQKRKKR